MKIIDLLNKIANGEEVPKKIKWQDTKYEYNSSYKNYVNDYEDLFSVIDGTNFSDEIEIIEEDKKIEKITLDDWIEITTSEDMKNLDYFFNKNSRTFVNKINELIDKVNNIKN